MNKHKLFVLVFERHHFKIDRHVLRFYVAVLYLIIRCRITVRVIALCYDVLYVNVTSEIAIRR